MRLTHPDAVVPGPGLAPDQVVLAQLAGLRACPREPQDEGVLEAVARVWAFASPGNRQATGPLPRFAAMLQASAYRGLLGHRAAQLGPVLADGDAAQVEVLLLTADDRTEGYTWVLGRQSGPPHAGCWLTDGVVRHPEAGPGPQDAGVP